MKTYRILLLQAVVGVCLTPFTFAFSQGLRADDVDYSALVRAITAVESGGNPRAIGHAGERGLMQIKLETWRQVTKKEFGGLLPFARAFEPELNQQVGQAYLEQLACQLAQNKNRLNDSFLRVLVASYHCGPTSVESAGYSVHRLSPQVQEYVQRVLNLHDFYVSETKLLAMASPSQTTGSTAMLTSPN